ncbi:MAG: hypothetical protein ACU0CO_15255 [Shimia sp.]
MPHDPETFALIVSAGHWIVGAYLFPIAALIGLEASRGRGRPISWAIPALLAGAGATLALYVVFHDPDRWREMLSWALRDTQQIQHLLFSALLLAVALAEWRANRTGRRSWGVVWPVGYTVLGAAFVIHEQLGEHAREKWLYHVALGTAIMMVGLLRGAQVLRVLSWRHGGLAMAAALVVVGGMLVTYRENADGLGSHTATHKTGTSSVEGSLKAFVQQGRRMARGGLDRRALG